MDTVYILCYNLFIRVAVCIVAFSKIITNVKYIKRCNN